MAKWFFVSTLRWPAGMASDRWLLVVWPMSVQDLGNGWNGFPP